MFSSPHEVPNTVAQAPPAEAVYQAMYDTLHDGLQSPPLKIQAASQLKRFETNHDSYLEGQATAARLSASQSRLDVQTLHVGQAAAFDIDSRSTLLKPEELGLPAFDQKDFKPCGLVVRRSDRGEVSLQLLTIDAHGDPRPYYLESMSAGVAGPNHAAGDAKWVAPGHAKLANTKRITTTRLDSKGFSTEIIVPSPDDGSTYEIIRPQPTHHESKLAFAHSPYDQERARKVNRVAKRATRIAAGVLGISSLFVGTAHQFEPSENPSDRIVTTADDLVGSSKVQMNGNKPQAEAMYDDATLGRARDAVRAYMAGDTQALEAQRQQYGYQSNWAKPEAVQALSEAQNFTELEQRFAAIVPTDRIILKTNNGDAYRTPYGIKLTTDDFVNAKKTAEAIVEVLQSFDLRLVKSSALTIVLSKHLQIDNKKVDGFVTWPANNRMDLDVQGADLKTNVAHEFTHYFDKKQGMVLSQQMSSLNPSGLSKPIYVTAYEGKGTDVGGYKVTVREYGREDASEDAGTVGEQWSSGKGAVTLDASPAGEKSMDYLLWLEKQYPGASAEFLAKAQPTIYTKANPADLVVYGIGEVGNVAPLGLLEGMFAAAFVGAIGTGIQSVSIKRRSRPRHQAK